MRESEADLDTTVPKQVAIGSATASSVATNNVAPLDNTQIVHNIFKPLWAWVKGGRADRTTMQWNSEGVSMGNSYVHTP